jgi:hypothetical protein
MFRTVCSIYVTPLATSLAATKNPYNSLLDCAFHKNNSNEEMPWMN